MKKALLLLLVLPALASCGGNRQRIMSKTFLPIPCVCKFSYGFYTSPGTTIYFEDSCHLCRIGDRAIRE